MYNTTRISRKCIKLKETLATYIKPFKCCKNTFALVQGTLGVTKHALRNCVTCFTYHIFASVRNRAWVLTIELTMNRTHLEALTLAGKQTGTLKMAAW